MGVGLRRSFVDELVFEDYVTEESFDEKILKIMRCNRVVVPSSIRKFVVLSKTLYVGEVIVKNGVKGYYSLVKELRRLKVDVLPVVDTDFRGVADEELIEIANRNGRVLLTRDSDFVRMALKKSSLCLEWACWAIGRVSITYIFRALLAILGLTSLFGACIAPRMPGAGPLSLRLPAESIKRKDLHFYCPL